MKDPHYSPVAEPQTFPSNTSWFLHLISWFSKIAPLSLDWDKAEDLKGPQQKSGLAWKSPSTSTAVPNLLAWFLPSLDTVKLCIFHLFLICGICSASQGGLFLFYRNPKLVKIFVVCP